MPAGEVEAEVDVVKGRRAKRLDENRTVKLSPQTALTGFAPWFGGLCSFIAYLQPVGSGLRVAQTLSFPAPTSPDALPMLSPACRLRSTRTTASGRSGCSCRGGPPPGASSWCANGVRGNKAALGRLLREVPGRTYHVFVTHRSDAGEGIWRDYNGRDSASRFTPARNPPRGCLRRRRPVLGWCWRTY